MASPNTLVLMATRAANRAGCSRVVTIDASPGPSRAERRKDARRYRLRPKMRADRRFAVREAKNPRPVEATAHVPPRNVTRLGSAIVDARKFLSGKLGRRTG